MSANEHLFRGTAFGGFNRQDVMHYIESATREHNNRVSQLKASLDAEAANRNSLERKLSASEGEAAHAAARAQAAETALLKANDERRATAGELEGKLARLAAAERELSDLREQIARIAPAATAYEGLKDRAATIELEAHNRAQSIITQAESAADTTRASMLVWVEKVKASYERLRADVEATLAHADGELDRARKSLEGMGSEFVDYDTAMSKILSAYQTGPVTKEVPVPLPLDSVQ